MSHATERVQRVAAVTDSLNIERIRTGSTTKRANVMEYMGTGVENSLL